MVEKRHAWHRRFRGWIGGAAAFCRGCRLSSFGGNRRRDATVALDEKPPPLCSAPAFHGGFCERRLAPGAGGVHRFQPLCFERLCPQRRARRRSGSAASREEISSLRAGSTSGPLGEADRHPPFRHGIGHLMVAAADGLHVPLAGVPRGDLGLLDRSQASRIRGRRYAGEFLSGADHRWRSGYGVRSQPILLRRQLVVLRIGCLRETSCRTGRA